MSVRLELGSEPLLIGGLVVAPGPRWSLLPAPRPGRAGLPARTGSPAPGPRRLGRRRAPGRLRSRCCSCSWCPLSRDSRGTAGRMPADILWARTWRGRAGQPRTAPVVPDGPRRARSTSPRSAAARGAGLTPRGKCPVSGTTDAHSDADSEVHTRVTDTASSYAVELGRDRVDRLFCHHPSGTSQLPGQEVPYSKPMVLVPAARGGRLWSAMPATVVHPWSFGTSGVGLTALVEQTPARHPRTEPRPASVKRSRELPDDGSAPDVAGRRRLLPGRCCLPS